MARFEIADAASVANGGQAGSAEVFFQLGMKYATGRDVDADLVTAHKWFNLAAMNGNKPAVGYRQELSLEMSSRDVAAAQRAAREWIRTH